MHRTSLTRAVLPTGFNVNRALTPTEVAANDLRQKFSPIGVPDPDVSIRDLFAVWKTAKGAFDYKASLYAMNVCYNFGLRLDHYELSTRLLSLCLACGMEEEAVKLIENYDCFLKNPPKRHVIFSLMGTLLTKGMEDEKYLWECRKVLQFQREKWQIPLTPGMYVLGIEGMLRINVNEALILWDDAVNMQVRLPLPTLASIIEKMLEADDRHDRLDEFLLLLRRRKSWHCQGLRCSMLCAWANIGTAGWSKELLKALENAHLQNYAFNGTQVPQGFIAALEADAEYADVLTAVRSRLGRFIKKGAT